MFYRTTGPLAAVLVLALAATVVWQVIESRDLRQRMVLLEQEISSHQEQLNEAVTQANGAGITAAMHLIDSTGFHDMELALEDGELDPRYPEAVGRTISVARALKWPERLQQPARSFVEAADSLRDALEREDLVAAREVIAVAHDRQHLLSHEAYAVLDTLADPAAISETGGDTSRNGATGAPDSSSHHAEQQSPEPEVDAVLEIGESGGAMGGARTFRTDRGERFHLRVVPAAAGVLHLHGYSLEWELESGATRMISVEADIVGRFPFELHPAAGESGIAVGYLEVRP